VRRWNGALCGALNSEEATMVTDPVCKMTIDESKAAGKSEYNGKTYFFCASGCKAKFDANPAVYVKQS
jgi:YHS domain-containing protein